MMVRAWGNEIVGHFWDISTGVEERTTISENLFWLWGIQIFCKKFTLQQEYLCFTIVIPVLFFCMWNKFHGRLGFFRGYFVVFHWY